MNLTFVYRLVKDKYYSISIWQVILKDNKYYFVGNGPVTPSDSTVEGLKRKYDKLFDAFSHPVVDIADIQKMAG